MRITQNMMFRIANEAIRRNAIKLIKSQEQISTGKKINKPSDDPVDTGDILNLRTSISKTNQFLSNDDRATSILSSMDSALQLLSGLIIRAKSLTVQAANDAVMSPENKIQLAIDLTGMFQELIEVANTQYMDQYIFSGNKIRTQTLTPLGIQTNALPGNSGNAEITATDIKDMTKYTFDNYTITFTSPPVPPSYTVTNQRTGEVIATGTYTSGAEIVFDGFSVTISDLVGSPQNGDSFEVITDNVGTYQGDTNSMNIEIDDELMVDITLTGDRIFKGVGGGTDIIQSFVDLIRALRQNDIDEINEGLANLDNSQEQILDFLSVAGAKQNEVNNISEKLKDLLIVQKSVLSKIEDADMIEASSEFAKDQFAFQTTLKANAQILQQSLLDYLK